MKVIRSTSIIYKEPFTIEKIYNFFKEFTSCRTNLFLSKDGLSINVKTFSALISFFLMLKKDDSFLLILEGTEADKAIESLLN